MFGKIENGRLVIAGTLIIEGETKITNPTEEQLRDFGYKEIEYTERPSYDDENETLTEKYTEEETKIIVGYDIEVLNDYAHNEIIKRKIEEEEKKITDRRQREFDLQKEGAEEFIRQVDDNIVALRAKLRPISEEADE